jgi:cytochrome c oxidase assembly protein subunit 15
MSEKDNKAVTAWLFTVCVLIMLMIVVGGYVRLTRSGLSIVEWKPVAGVIPPIGEEAWQQEFVKYQQTPEFQKVNKSMTLDEYKGIFYVEYFHRLIARFVGFLVVIPLFYFLWKGIIPWRKSAIYLAIGLLFAFQGFLGWYMVSSGLTNVPAVSHFRLTIHLLMALFLLALTLWTALNHHYRFPKRISGVYRSTSFILSALLIAVLVLQISYGGLVAGLKAGYISSTYPLMFGYLVPPGLLSLMQPWWRNLIEAATTVHFVHRWFAIVVLTVSIILYFLARKRSFSSELHRSLIWMMVLVGVQIFLGALVIWFHVTLVLALLHQATALILFVVAFFINYRIVYEPLPYPGKLEPRLELTAA